MRSVKYIVTLLLLILGLMIQNEVFQKELLNFDTGEFLSVSFTDEENREGFINEIEELANSQSVIPFAVFVTLDSSLERHIEILGDEPAREVLREKLGIEEGVYKSLSNGVSRVSFLSFHSLLEKRYHTIYTFSFIGEEKDVIELYDVLSEQYDITYPRIEGSNEHDLTYIVWSSIIAVVFLMNLLDVIYRKKEVSVRVIMGQNVVPLIVRNMAIDIFIGIMLYFIAYGVCAKLVSGVYMQKQVFSIYVLGLFMSSLNYIGFVFHNVRKIFANVIFSRKLYFITYGIKIVVSIITLIVIISNMNLAIANYKLVTHASLPHYLDNYSFVQIMNRNRYIDSGDYDRKAEEMKSISQEMLSDYYDDIQPYLCEVILEDTENQIKYVYVNDIAMPIVEDWIEGELEADSIILIAPYAYENSISLSDLGINNPDRMIYYSGNRALSCMNCNAEKGFISVTNPVIIVNTYKGYDKLDQSFLPFSLNTLYKMENNIYEEITSKFNLAENGYYLVRTSVSDMYRYYSNLLKQGIKFSSTVVVFMVILQSILVLLITSMEYRLHGMEYAQRKIIGNNLLMRYRVIMSVGVAVNMLSIILVIIIGKMNNMYSVAPCVLIGGIFILIELMIKMICVIKLETTNTVKILKGGCL